MATYKCHKCGKPVDEDDTLWVSPVSGVYTTGDKGEPFHEACAPAEVLVDLEPTAYLWTCPSCTQVNITPKEEFVICEKCGEEFRTK